MAILSSGVEQGYQVIMFTEQLVARPNFWCSQCLLNSSQVMDYFGFSSVSSGSYDGDPLDEDALAAAVADLGAPPAPAGFGYVEPSQGLEPHRVTTTVSCGSPWNVSACQSVYVSAALPLPRGPDLLQFSGPRMSLTRPAPSSVDCLLAQRAAVDHALATLVGYCLFYT